MDTLFDPALYAQLYNCSFYTISSIPLAKRQHIPLGIFYLACFVLCESLYLPCMVIIFRQCRNDSQSSCYRIMFYIGVADITALWISGFYTGAGAIAGWVFCSAPSLNYWMGMLGEALWASETTGTVVLALNRVLSLLQPRVCDALFGSNRKMWVWLAVVAVYSFYYGFFNPPIIFSAVIAAWSYNPHQGYYDDSVYSTKHAYVSP